MTVARFARLRNCGVFKDFTWPAGLDDFKRYNLIYGWNGTGKSTLARILRDVERRRPSESGEVTVRLGTTDVRGGDFGTVTVPIRVFNKDFVDEAVFPAAGGMRPIFVIGPENAEDQRRVDALRSERMRAEDALQAARRTLASAATSLDDFCETQARLIKTALRSPAQHRYNNYNRTTFRQDAEQLAVQGDSASHRLDEAERDAADRQMRGSPKPALSEATFDFPDLVALRTRVSELLGRSVVAEILDTLKNDPPLEAWARQGLSLHISKGREKCLFCEQTMPPARIQALERHFNNEYQQLLGQLDSVASTIRGHQTALNDLRFPDASAFYEELAEAFSGALEQVETDRARARRELQRLLSAVEEKRGKLFLSVSPPTDTDTLSGSSMSAFNAVIQRHNGISRDFQGRVDAARERLAKHMLVEALSEFTRHRDAVDQANAAVAPAAAKVQRLTREIDEIEESLVLHRLPAEQLNDDLKKYLGHGELQLTVQDTGYTVSRNGAPAVALSEGERTAIALLYFLKSLEDRGFNLRDGVVVLDDPVSSLDQTALFAAFGFLRARTQAAAQVILLTHSFMFFRLAREWFRNLRGPDKNRWRLFMLRCQFGPDGRAADLRDIDPLLAKYESEYQYLFARMYEMATAPPAASLEAYYMAPSIARRVLESFLAFKLPNLGGDSNLWARMREITFDEERRSRIYRFVQTHSHRDAAGDGDEDLNILSESRSILNDVLAFMRASDDNHVSRLISLLSPEQQAEEAAT